MSGGFAWSPHCRRFQKQFHQAQLWLDDRVLQDAAPFVPVRTGKLLRRDRKSVV